MENNYEKCIVAIIGDPLRQRRFVKYFKNFHEGQILGALRSICLKFPKTKLLQLENTSQFARFLSNMIDSTKKKKTSLEFVEKWSPNENYSYFVRCLCLVDGISIKKAQKIEQNYNFFTNIKIDSKKLTKVNGIGKKLAERIVKEFEV